LLSVEGHHRTVAIWEYDKRSVNGAQFVYYGMRLYESEDGEREDALVKYMHLVLDALDVKHGSSHGEIMWTSTGPCLIEVGSRPHGGEGTFVSMTEKPIGYNQLSVLIDAHENRSKFYALPERPAKLMAHSMEACLVNTTEGHLESIPGIDEVRKLESFVADEIKVDIGGFMPITVDFITSPGSIMLCHEDKEVLERDQEKIHELMSSGKLMVVGRFKQNSL
jgi:hypothetical protein